MSTPSPSPLLRPLQILAAALAVAIAVLLVQWVQMEPAPALAQSPGERPAAPDPVGVPAASTATTSPAAAAPQAPVAVPVAPSATPGERAVLFGSLRDANGKAVPSGMLWLTRNGKRAGSGQLRDGGFVFAGLEPGTHRLTSRIDDQLPLDREVEVRAPTTRLDIELAGRWLLTIDAVTPDGTPWLEAVRKAAALPMLRTATVLAFTEPLAGDLPSSNHAEVRGGVGTFRAGNDPFERGKAMAKQTLGVLTLPPGQPVHVAILLRNVLVAQQAVAPGQTEVTFTLPAAALTQKLAKVRMRIVDPSGAPVAKAQVALNDAQTGGGGNPTGDDGRVALTNVVPGRLELEIWGKDLSAPHVVFEVPPGADLDLGDVTLQPPTKVELRFDAFEGKGSVRANLLDTIRPGWASKDLYFSTDNGKSMTYELFPGRYGFLATGPSGVALMVLDLRTPPPGPIRFDLRPGADLRIEYAFGAASASYQVTSAEGVLVRRREVSGSAGETVPLPPGSYTVVVTDQTGVATRRDFTLPAAGMTLTLP